MSAHSSIQWTDTTVNPVAGCNGCELFPSNSRLIVRELENLLQSYSLGILPSLRDAMLAVGPTGLLRNRLTWIAKIVEDTDPAGFYPQLARDLEKCIMSLFRCYAGSLTNFFNAGGNHRGYPRVFEEPRQFPGRMAKAAKLPDLTGMNRDDKPWLNGLPRLLFVSDMGDALSREIDFDFLKQEIIDVVQSPDGLKHIWIWLTKRPSRMAEFGRWLKDKGIDWPDHLVAATSVTDRATLKRLDHLRQVPARVRMVSIEPLVESIEPDLTGIDWAIVGGESGHHAQPFEITWIDALHTACIQHGTALFVKQLGAEPLLNGEPYQLQDGHGGDWSEWPERYQIRNVPDAWHRSAV